MAIKKNKFKQVDYFKLPEEDRLEIHLQDKEQAEKDDAIDQVFKKLNKKLKKKP